jgi:hypothetical protein
MSKRRIPAGGTRGTVYREVARQRWADATALLEAERFSGAIYLAGYAIECHLKYAVCRRKGRTYLPAELEVHDWDTLVDSAGLDRDFRGKAHVTAIYSMLAEEWGPALRYGTRDLEAKEAARLYKAMEKLYLHLAETVP